MIGPEYRLLAEALPQIIWVTDETDAVEYINQKYIEA